MEKTKIQWIDATVNFWTGCQKVSAGCKFCYMYRDKERFHKEPTIVMRTNPSTFCKALKWKDPRMIFTCSYSDFFIAAADNWRKDAWDVIRKTPQHVWQILTKRPERIIECLPEDWGDGWDNVWLDVTIENQDYMHRAEILAKVSAKTRFISAEPLIGEINLSQYRSLMDRYHWCIIGGESGNEVGDYRYRECKQEWIEKIIADLSDTSVSIFVKQMGTHPHRTMKLRDRHGGNIDEWPEHLQIRNFPTSDAV